MMFPQCKVTQVHKIVFIRTLYYVTGLSPLQYKTDTDNWNSFSWLDGLCTTQQGDAIFRYLDRKWPQVGG